MTFSLSLGVAFLAAVAFLIATRRVRWPSAIITFTAGVLLAGSTVGLLAQRTAESGAQVVQTGVSAVSGAADQAAHPAQPKPAAVRKATP